jgi:DNA mismatch repair protein MSH2
MEEIKQELTACQDELEICLKDMNEEWTQVSGKEHQVRLESLDNGDYQFRLPNTNDAKLLQARFQHIFVHRLLKNGVYFSTRELRQLATKKQDLIAEYDKHQRSIVVDAMKVAATYVPVLERVSSLVSQLDVLCSLAHVAAYSPTGYCKPTLTDGDEDGLGIEVRFMHCDLWESTCKMSLFDIFSHSLSCHHSSRALVIRALNSKTLSNTFQTIFRSFLENPIS